KVRAGDYDLVLLDVNMPRLTGIEALKEIKAHDPAIIVIILTAYSNVKDAVAATKEGAYNYLEKPIKAENLVYLIDKALKAHKLVTHLSFSAPRITLPNGGSFVGECSEMKKVFSVIDKLAQVDTAVLIRGESGTGKELVAQALHFNGPRKENRFVTVNCSAIPENLIESEFFGHEKGSFTGADTRKIGKFQFADGGTLFLDEIGDISSAMQVKLLRALQEKKFTPVGSNREIEVNIRVVAATNRNLEEMIQKGEFREDLFYRLNVLPIHLPPLRERTADIEKLCRYFIDKFNEHYKKSIQDISEEAQKLLHHHKWPGNIRELENVIEHAFVIESSDTIHPESLPSSLQASSSSLEGVRHAQVLKVDSRPTIELKAQPLGQDDKGFKLEITKLDFQANKEEFEKTFLLNALKSFKGRINQTALHANIPKKTLLRKLEKYGINAKDFTSES
ncbi:MAG: two-component system response regulator, partial [Bdellovibrionaceae bacterium]|nr:two-component system response regulator [Pseudobdellovibrionaceae bacterium]